MKPEKPIKVIPHTSRKHKTETRVFAREIHETYCVDPKCKWRGQPAQQGVCHTQLGRVTRAYLDEVEKRCMDIPMHIRLSTKSHAEYVKSLEYHLVCARMNAEFGLDELARLRMEVGELKMKLKEFL